MKSLNVFDYDLISEYLAGNSMTYLAEKYDTTIYKIHKILDLNDIPKISIAKLRNPTFKEDYFEEIDTSEKAYWLGWILTDGGVMKSNLRITLQARDVGVLNRLGEDLGVPDRVKDFDKDGKYKQINVSSVKMCKDLERYGVVPNKTLTLKFPKIDESFEVPLIRGMFEGDGGLTIGTATRFIKERGKSYTSEYRELSFTGTYDMCDGFQNVILKNTDLSQKNIGRNHSIYRVRWSNRDEILKILDMMYENCGDHYLERKYALYQTIKGGIPNEQ